MKPSNESNTEAALSAEIQAQAEQIAELQNAIGETCKLLGHEGNDGADLHDAIGQIERLADGKDRDGIPLSGLAAKLRQRLHVPTDLQLVALLETRSTAVYLSNEFNDTEQFYRQARAARLLDSLRAVVTLLDSE